MIHERGRVNSHVPRLDVDDLIVVRFRWNRRQCLPSHHTSVWIERGDRLPDVESIEKRAVVDCDGGVFPGDYTDRCGLELIAEGCSPLGNANHCHTSVWVRRDGFCDIIDHDARRGRIITVRKPQRKVEWLRRCDGVVKNVLKRIFGVAANLHLDAVLGRGFHGSRNQ